MRALSVNVLCAVVALALVSSAAHGQGAGFSRNLWNRPTPSSGPTVSPYLNLLRAGNSATQNYYGLVRPQQNFRGDITGLQSDLQSVGSGVSNFNRQQETTQTGHRSGFMTHGNNFMNLGAGAASAGKGARASGSSQIPSTRPKSGRR